MGSSEYGSTVPNFNALEANGFLLKMVIVGGFGGHLNFEPEAIWTAWLLPNLKLKGNITFIIIYP